MAQDSTDKNGTQFLQKKTIKASNKLFNLQAATTTDQMNSMEHYQFIWCYINKVLLGMHIVTKKEAEYLKVPQPNYLRLTSRGVKVPQPKYLSLTLRGSQGV